MYINRIIRRLHNVYLYAKQGWNTCNYDHDYFLQDMQFKLKLLAKEQIIKNMFQHEGYYSTTKEILRAVHMIQYIRDEKIMEITYEDITKKYGELRMFTEDVKSGGGYRVLLLRDSQIDNPSKSDEINEDIVNLILQGQKDFEKHILETFKYIGDHYRNWWK